MSWKKTVRTGVFFPLGIKLHLGKDIRGRRDLAASSFSKKINKKLEGIAKNITSENYSAIRHYSGIILGASSITKAS